MKPVNLPKKYRPWLLLGSLLASAIILVTLTSRVSSRIGTWLTDNHLSWFSLSSGQSSATNTMDLSGWQYFPGAKATKTEVQFRPVVRQIIGIGGGASQADPAVNISGQYLGFDGDFILSVQLQAAKVPGIQSLRLYAEPPVIYDEWRSETPSLDIQLNGAQLNLDSYDGTRQQPSHRQFIIRPSAQYNLSVARRDSVAEVYLNNQLIAKQSQPELFANNRLWFGAGGTAVWSLNKVSVSGHNAAFKLDRPLVKKTPNRGTYAELMARRGKLFGAAVSLYPLISDNRYQNLAINQFSQFTTENELKFQFVHPEPNSYTFGPADLLVSLAQTQGIVVHGHALVFGEANPNWTTQTPRAELQSVMVDHISTVVGHYRDSIHEWDVINEPLSDQDADYQTNGLRRHIWYRAMGEGYIALALRAARSANPSAKLYINDYGLEAEGDRWDALLALIKKLQTQKVPLDGIGFESHICEPGDEVDGSVLAEHFKQLLQLGLKARISEIDVHGENQTQQARQYATVLAACLRASNCTSFTTWGITDKYGSTTSDHSYPLDYGNDLLWDKGFQPKPAASSLQNLLNSARP